MMIAVCLLVLCLTSSANQVTKRHLLNVDPINTVNWTAGSSNLPNTDYNMASFLYNNTVYLLGGAGSTRNTWFITFDPQTQVFIDLTSTSQLSAPCEGDAQFYTQINNKAYWAGATTISIYDLSTNVESPNAIPDVNNTMGDVCLASHNNLLFVVGGTYDTGKGTYPILSTLHVYDILTSSWLNNAPTMIHPRAAPTCIVHPQTNMLYAIGGKNLEYANGDYEVKIERISVDDVINNAWTELTATLLVGVIKARSVIYEDYIVVIGGDCKHLATGCSGTVDAVQLIDVIADTVSYGPSLRSARQQIGAVYNDNERTIYVFGGFVVDTYSYLRIQTASPTSDPTKGPTVVPTQYPTKYPTENPTSAPTSPTNTPTYAPTSLTNPPSSATNAPSLAPRTASETSTATSETNTTAESALDPRDSVIAWNVFHLSLVSATVVLFFF